MAGRVTSFNVQGEDYRVEADLQFDSTPTAGSTNPVTSNGIFDAIKGAAIGDDISIGRIAGSNIGYRSVVYGTNSAATGPYSIVFGSNNRSLASEMSFMSGYGNTDCGTGHNLTLGSDNFNRGVYTVVFGQSNNNGQGLQSISDLDSSLPNVYIGYISQARKKIYHDENFTNEIILNPDQDTNGRDAYFIDCTSTNEGNVYLLKYAWNSVSRKWVRNSLTKYDDFSYIDITNVTHTDTYNYLGVAYYKASADKLYSDSALTTEIPYNQDGRIYLDLNNNLLIRQNTRDYRASGYKSDAKWVHFSPYIGYNANSPTLYGRYAYIQDYSLEVYSDPDKTTSITNEIFDGETVIDYNGTRIHRYFFNKDHRLVSVSENLNLYNQSNSNIIAGHENYISNTTSTYGTLVVGDDNDVKGPSLASIVSGQHNSLVSYNRLGGTAAIFGFQNNVTVGNGNGQEPKILGGNNTITLPSGSYNDVLIGQNNELTGRNGEYSVILGGYNIAFDVKQSIISGSSTYANSLFRSCVIGSDNEIHKEVYFNGSRSETSDVSPDEYGVMPTSYQSNRLYRVIKRSGNYGDGKIFNCFQNYAYSSDGTTLSTITAVRQDSDLHVFGSHNKVLKTFENYTGSINDPTENTVIGHQNTLISSSTVGVTLLGYGLTYQGSTNAAKSGVSTVFAGTYNADSGDYINSVPCKFLVGIGTADSNRKNGLAVLGSGVVLAPESPNSIASASAASGNTAEKMLVTYAMLQDYAPKTPGAIGKPAQTIVTLTAADWSSLEQTVDISDMTASAVVLTEPSGNPHMYYANDVYLSSQTDGHLTFGCTSAPSGDVSVKVVYWP